MKKIAILLTGIPRYFYCLDEIKHIMKNNEVYIFLWYWDPVDSSDLVKNSWSGSFHGGTADLNFNPNIFNFPSVHMEHKCENWKKTESIFLNKKQEIQHLFDKSTRKDLGVYGMWYAVMKSNEMREEYEKKHNIIFDCVMRARFELKLMKSTGHPDASNLDFRVEDFDMDKLWKSHTNSDSKYGMSDCFAFSSSKNMSHYCRMYENINECATIEGEVWPEAIAFHHNKNQYEMLPQYIFLGK